MDNPSPTKGTKSGKSGKIIVAKENAEGQPAKKKQRKAFKLTADILFADNRMEKLKAEFKKVKWRGEGREFEDGELYYRIMARFTQQYCPLPFEEFAEQIAKVLASNIGRENLQRIIDPRAAEAFDADFAAHQAEQEQKEQKAKSAAAKEMEQFVVEDEGAGDDDDDWMAASSNPQQSSATAAAPTTAAAPPVTPADTPARLPAAIRSLTAAASPFSEFSPSDPRAPSPSLTSEQLARIERQKKLALERKAQRASLSTPLASRTTSVAAAAMPAAGSSLPATPDILAPTQLVASQPAATPPAAMADSQSLQPTQLVASQPASSPAVEPTQLVDADSQRRSESTQLVDSDSQRPPASVAAEPEIEPTQLVASQQAASLAAAAPAAAGAADAYGTQDEDELMLQLETELLSQSQPVASQPSFPRHDT